MRSGKTHGNGCSKKMIQAGIFSKKPNYFKEFTTGGQMLSFPQIYSYANSDGGVYGAVQKQSVQLA